MKSDHDRLLAPQQAAAHLGISPATLAKWRCTRRYPLKWIKVGGRVKYRLADLEAFIQSRMQ